MKSGLQPHVYSRKDYDFLKTKKLGAATLPTFPADYNVDAGLWAPNQNDGSTIFTPPVPPMPYGCTNYSQCDLAADQDGCLYNPSYLEAKTGANAKGGLQLRDSLDAVVKYGVQAKNGEIVTTLHPAYFNIRSSWKIDFFDAVRLAMFSASNEKRGVSVGSPWWLQWGATPTTGIAPAPDYNLNFATWHNWCVKGWKTINGETYLIGKPWLGGNWGDKGFFYVSRPMFNATMNVRGSVMFTLDKLLEGEEVQKVDWKVVEIIRNFILDLLRL